MRKCRVEGSGNGGVVVSVVVTIDNLRNVAGGGGRRRLVDRLIIASITTPPMAIPTANPVDTPPPDDGDGGEGGDLSVPGVDVHVFLLCEDGEFPLVSGDGGESGDPDGEDGVGTMGDGAKLVRGGVEARGACVLEGGGGGEDADR
ncbi:Uncharacterized protein Fot_49136 [Forsythia ovata]|uniref:Uncharacterized protein n=1 Tax=Forsythia ovata TaxID=205694 RepID=A0ABD1QB13_9LAMI